MKHLALLSLVFLSACAGKLRKHVFPDPVDTTTRPVAYQVKTTYAVDGVSASNEFPAARLNDFIQLNDSTFQASISPENVPINPSPWYAFQLWSTSPRTIYLRLHYTEHKHRYAPKLSQDGENWTPLSADLVQAAGDEKDVILQLDLTAEKLWVSAQEIEDHRRVGEWSEQLATSPLVSLGSAGESVQGRSLYYLNITKGEARKKPTIVVISRQHPPEVTGYLAMQAFVEQLVEEGASNGFLDRFRVMVYPLMNPDGVDLGHHRHNTGGIDMNRDWSFYHQPENRQIVEHIVAETNREKNNVVLGLDFHSTYRDVYYTYDNSVTRKIPGFTSEWLSRIEIELDLEDINEQPSGYGAPISKGWFTKQLGAEGIVYEIGDSTPRDFIHTKGAVSATQMMNILLERGEEWKLY